MTFIAILIALMTERFLDFAHVRHWQWFFIYQHWLYQRLAKWSAPWFILTCLAPPLFITGCIEYLLNGWLYNFPTLLFDIIVLLYCFGPRNFWIDSYASMNALHHQEQVHAIKTIDSGFGTTDNSSNPQIIHQRLINKLYTESYSRVFSVLFWFALLGPLGTVLYRMSYLLMSREESPLNSKLKIDTLYIRELLDWVPVRLFAFIFALGGHFVKTFSYWQKHLWQKPLLNEDLVIHCGIAAADITHGDKILEDGSAEKNSLALLDRVYVITLVILAVFILLT